MLITGGSLPPGMQPDFYYEAINLAREKGVPVIFDASEPNLEAGLRARPDFIKPNEHELSALVGRKLKTDAELYAAGRDILERYGTQGGITMGKDGALAVLRGPQLSHPADCASRSAARPARAMRCWPAWRTRIHHEQPLEEGLRLGVAAATAVCLQPGTAAYDIADMQRFLPQVELIPYPS